MSTTAGPGIVSDLASLAVDIDRLHTLPGNPRRGDVEAVMRSYKRFGQRKPIVALRDGTITAGNHQWLAAKRLGWEQIAVVWTDDDAATAHAWSLADNRSAELGSYDPSDLLAMINEVRAEGDAELIAAISYSDAAIAEITKALERDDTPAGDQSGRLDSAFSVVVECRDESEQLDLLNRFTAEGLTCRALIA